MIIASVLARTGRCHCCGASLRYSPHSGGDPNEYYCSVRCLHRAPPLLARAMESTGILDPRECMLHALRSTDTQARAADLLGMDATVFGECIRRHGIRRRVVWS